MRIEKLDLAGYIYLQFSNIQNLSILTESKTQVIIGDNGSGKSKLMSMFAPTVPLSTVFTKHGGMELHCEHGGHHYIIGYDAASKTHSFQQDGVELNDSGTSMVSEELIETHLGYNKLIDKLIFNKMKMTQMASAARMEFLTSINPVNIKFMKDRYVKILSKLKKTKAQLELLHKRSSEYKAAMIDEIEYSSYEKEYTLLQQFDNEVIQLIYKYDSLYSTTPDDTPSKTIEEYNDILIKLRHFRANNTFKAWSVNYSSIDDLENMLDRVRATLNENISRMEAVSKEINELEKVVATSDVITLSDLEARATLIKESLSKIPDLSNAFVIAWPPTTHEHTAYTALHNLTALSEELCGTQTSRVWLSKKYRFHKERYVRLIRLRDETSKSLSDCQFNCAEITKYAESATSIKPDSTCCSTSCPLRTRYNEVLNNEQRKIVSCKNNITILQKQLSKYIRIIEIYDRMMPYQDNYYRVSGILKTLAEYIKDISIQLASQYPTSDDLVTALNKNPNSINTHIKKILTDSVMHSDKLQLTAELEKIEMLISTKKADVSIEYARKKIIENYTLFHSLEKEIENAKEFIVSIEVCLAYERKMSAAIRQTESMLTSVTSDVIAYENQAKRNAYLSTKMQLSELHNKISQMLRDMETLISDQKRIRQLYDAENKSLSKYETAALELTSMEKILNPYTGLPSVYTRKYIEKILNHVNYFISRVFTYKLEVSLVEDVKNMKYKFSVKVDDVPAGDISDCSDGQMEIIDLAFTLALMIALGIYKTHPIFLDEVGRCFDSYHTQRLLEMLSDLVDQGYISQLFIINHQAVLAGGFDKADVICLRSENIVLPEDYNQHVVIR